MIVCQTQQFLASPLRDTGAMALLIVAVASVLICYRSGYKYFDNFFHKMFSVKRRENLFEDRTVSETKVLTALVAHLCVVAGFLGFYALGAFRIIPAATLHSHIFASVALLSAIALAFYLLQLGAYALLGYVFADAVATRLWLDGFKASQSLLGLLLLPVLLLIFIFPQHLILLLLVAAALYILGRLIFIFKTLRIFFNKTSRYFYFLLYLCGAEIVPLLFVGSATIAIFHLIYSV